MVKSLKTSRKQIGLSKSISEAECSGFLKYVTMTDQDLFFIEESLPELRR